MMLPEDVDETPSHSLLARFRHSFAAGYSREDIIAEFKSLFSITWPVVLSYLGTMTFGLTTMMFVGRLGALELATAALSIVFCNVTGLSFGIGLLAAMDTLISQAYGAQAYRRVGTILQRGILIITVYCVLSGLLWYNAENFLMLFKQDPELSKMVGTWVRYALPGLWPMLIFECMKRYLQSQAIVRPLIWVLLGVNVLHVFNLYVFIFAAGFGIVGAPIAQAISWSVLPIVLFLYIRLAKLHEKTWFGWSRDAFKGWLEFMRLGVPGAAMICLEWWGFECTTLMAGLIGTVEVAAHTAITNMLGLFFMVPLGLSIACCVRVGTLLGDGDADRARLVTRLAMSVAVGIQAFFVVMLLVLHPYLGRLFSEDPAVLEISSKLYLVATLFVASDGLQCVAGGPLRGLGRNTAGALVNLASYYVVGLPLAALLCFVAGLGVVGIWFGMATAVLSILLGYVFFLTRTDWHKASEEARSRALQEESQNVAATGLIGSALNLAVDTEHETSVTADLSRLHDDTPHSSRGVAFTAPAVLVDPAHPADRDGSLAIEMTDVVVAADSAAAYDRDRSNGEHDDDDDRFGSDGGSERVRTGTALPGRAALLTSNPHVSVPSLTVTRQDDAASDDDNDESAASEDVRAGLLRNAARNPGDHRTRRRSLSPAPRNNADIRDLPPSAKSEALASSGLTASGVIVNMLLRKSTDTEPGHSFAKS